MDSAEEKLHKLVTEYKRYDARRNKYYAAKMIELGKLQSLIQELEDANGINNLPNLIKTIQMQNKSLREEIKRLREELDNTRMLFDPETLHVYRNLSTKDDESLKLIRKLKNTIVSLEEKVKETEKLANEYLTNLIKLQIKHDS